MYKLLTWIVENVTTWIRCINAGAWLTALVQEKRQPRGWQYAANVQGCVKSSGTDFMNDAICVDIGYWLHRVHDDRVAQQMWHHGSALLAGLIPSTHD